MIDEMTITIKYFAGLSERLGRREDQVVMGSGRTVKEVWHAVNAEALPTNILIAVNMEYAHPETQVQDGDEVAFFPPITGG
jgi:sulfur-carrier protein